MTAFVTVLDRPAKILGLSPATEEGESKARIPQ